MRHYSNLQPIQALILAVQQQRQALRLRRFLQQSVQDVKPPQNLRPALSSDIVVDAVLWYPDRDENHLAIVDEVYDAKDDFKAYNDLMSNCTYGLKGAFVEAATWG